MSTSGGVRRSSNAGQPGSNGEFYHVPSGPNPPPTTETTAQSGTGKPGGATWTPVWSQRRGGDWMDINPRFTGNDKQCLTCGRIYGGPHKGEHPDHMVLGSHGYDKQHGRDAMDQQVVQTLRRQHPDASDAAIRGMLQSYRETHPYNDEGFPE